MCLRFFMVFYKQLMNITQQRAQSHEKSLFQLFSPVFSLKSVFLFNWCVWNMFFWIPGAILHKNAMFYWWKQAYFTNVIMPTPNGPLWKTPVYIQHTHQRSEHLNDVYWKTRSCLCELEMNTVWMFNKHTLSIRWNSCTWTFAHNLLMNTFI